MRIFCSICKEIFIPYSEIHVTNCGHLYHGSCISTWIKQHKTCPQCRAKTSRSFRVYFDVEKDNGDPSTLEHELEILSDKLREVEREKKGLQDECNNSKSIMESLRECALSLSNKNTALEASVRAFKVQITNLTRENKTVTRLENEVAECKSKIQTLEGIETIIRGSVEETNKLIESTPVTELAIRQLCTYVGVLKSQLHKTEEKNFKLAKDNRSMIKLLSEDIIKDSSETSKIKELEESNRKLKKELQSLKALYESSLKKEQTKIKEKSSVQKVTTEIKRKRSFFSIDVDIDKAIIKCSESVKSDTVDKTISHWEKLVCDGPSRNGGLFPKSKLFGESPSHAQNDCNNQRSASSYAFDGLGGRKKIRLGCPTPRDEFEKILIKKNKKTVKENCQNQKIIQYFELQ